MTTLISSCSWVPRGYAAQFPKKYAFDDKEYMRIAEMAKLQLNDAQADLDDAQNGDADEVKSDSIDASLKEYDLEHYDDEDHEPGETVGMFGNIKDLAYHESNDKDPYITLPDEEDDDDREELEIRPSDNLLLAAKTEDDVSHLEVFVYEDAEDHLYVHHDIMLPAFPLCVEWMDFAVGDEAKEQPASFAAVGTFEPEIEIWDLDTVDCLYPNSILGPKERKKRKKRRKPNDEYHVDAVMSLAWNRNHRNLLASGSADETIKLWDLATLQCAKSYQHHKGKVCAVDWNSRNSTMLLSGSYDRTAAASDMRVPDQVASRAKVESDVETVKWDAHDPNYFYVATEEGVIHYFDQRTLGSRSEAVWQLKAHDGPVSAFAVNAIIPGYLASGSSDKQVKLWNVQPEGPSMVVSRDMGLGKVFSTVFGPEPEVGFRLSVAGSKGVVLVWDTSTNAGVRKVFYNRSNAIMSEGTKAERMVGLVDDSSGSDDDEEEDDEDEAEVDGWESMEED